MKDQLNLKVFTSKVIIVDEENDKMVALQISPTVESLYELGREAKNYKDLYGILQLLPGSHLNNFQLKTLKLGWVHVVSFSNIPVEMFRFSI